MPVDESGTGLCQPGGGSHRLEFGGGGLRPVFRRSIEPVSGSFTAASTAYDAAKQTPSCGVLFRVCFITSNAGLFSSVMLWIVNQQ